MFRRNDTYDGKEHFQRIIENNAYLFGGCVFTSTVLVYLKYFIGKLAGEMGYKEEIEL
jgi:hypothetical protein